MCSATGKGHHDRSPCWVAAVDEIDETGKTLLSIVIKVEDLQHWLEWLHGLSAEKIGKGVSFEEARTKLIEFLSPNVVLVGQKVQKDIEALEQMLQKTKR